MKVSALKKNKTLIQLQQIHQRKQRGAFITQVDSLFFNQHVITSYGSALTAQLVLSTDEEPIVFQAPPLQCQLQLDILRHPNKAVPFWAVQPSKLDKIPENDCREPLRLMLTPYALLPKNLKQFQIKQIAQLEFCLKYSAAYIIRKRYRESFCSLPAVNKRLVGFCNSLADCWYGVLNLCSQAQDFLTNDERKKIPKSWNWLDLIVNEHRQMRLLGLTRGETPLVPKYKQADYWNSYAASLKKRQVPPSVDSKEQPYLFRLLDISTQVLGEALQDYITSIEFFARQVRREPSIQAVGFSENGFVLHEYRGK